MNNATYFGTARKLAEAYNLRLSLSGNYKKGYDYWIGGMVCYPDAPNGPFDYATSCADTAFNYRIGEIVRVNGRYDVVTKYSFDHKKSSNGVFDGFETKCKQDWVFVVREDRADEYKADIPNDVIDIIRSRLQQNCQLKTATCG